MMTGVLFSFSVANATLEPSGNALTGGNLATTAMPKSTRNLLMDYQVYSALRSGDIEVLGAVNDDGEEMAELKGQLLHIPEGSVLQFVDESEDGQEVSFSFDLEGMMADGQDVSDLPGIIKVRAADLARLSLGPIRLGEIESEEGIDEDVILPEIVAGKRAKKRKSTMTYCLQDVRLWASANCKAKVIRTEKAADARKKYLATGAWEPINLGSKWSKYPVCTACFYGGGRQDCSGGTACGHAAIKISANKWKGAGIRTVPGLPDRNGVFKGIKRRPYKFQGCIIPKGRKHKK
jgi:hypothetical protein